MHFGLTDREGQPKEQLRTLAGFAKHVRELAAEGWEPVSGEVAIVVPEHFERELPFTIPAYRQDIRDNLFQSYIAAREADLPVELQRENDRITDTARLYLSPCAKLLTAPGIDRLRELAVGGATVYVSYFAGSTPKQRGPWLAWLDEIFGVRHRLWHGLVDPIVDDEAIFQFVEDFGDIAVGTRLSFPVAGEPSARAYLPVDPVGAEIVAIDGHGRPGLLRYPLGSGCTVLCTYPLEHMAARTPSANPESTWRIYSALATIAGVARPVRVDDPRVLVGRLRCGGSDTVLFVNCSPDAIAAEPILAEGTKLRLTENRLALEPFGVALVRSEGMEFDHRTHAETRAPSMASTSEGRDARA
jgi:endo-1,4-beta-mannosidase